MAPSGSYHPAGGSNKSMTDGMLVISSSEFRRTERMTISTCSAGRSIPLEADLFIAKVNDEMSQLFDRKS